MKVIINKTQTSSLWISGKERVAGVRAADGRVWDGCATGGRDRAGVSHWFCVSSTLSPRMIRGDKVAVAHFQSVTAIRGKGEKGG